MKNAKHKEIFDIVLSYCWLLMMIILTFIDVFYKNVDYRVFGIFGLMIWFKIDDIFKLKR